MDEKLKMVEFDKWCFKCKHRETPMSELPCDECLGVPARPESTRPEFFEENESKKNA